MRSGQKSAKLVGVWGALALAAIFGCGDIPGLNPAAESRETSWDEDAQKMIDEGDVAEARAWLADDKTHKLWKGDRESIKKLVEQLYRSGAPKVYACGTKELIGGVQVVALFMAELPQEPARRAALFQVEADFWKGYLQDADKDELASVITPDKGQKFLALNFDL